MAELILWEPPDFVVSVGVGVVVNVGVGRRNRRYRRRQGGKIVAEKNSKTFVNLGYFWRQYLKQKKQHILDSNAEKQLLS